MGNRLIILAFLLLISKIATSQDTKGLGHSFETGYGGVFFGSGDLIGTALDFEYTLQINPYLGISPHINFAAAKQSASVWGNFDFTNSQTYDLILEFVPFPRSWDGFSIGIGPSYRIVNGIYGNGYQNQDNQQFGSSFDYPVYIEESTFGLSSELSVRMFRHNNLSIGVKSLLQMLYTNGDTAAGVYLYLGYKL